VIGGPLANPRTLAIVAVGYAVLCAAVGFAFGRLVTERPADGTSRLTDGRALARRRWVWAVRGSPQTLRKRHEFGEAATAARLVQPARTP